MHGMITPRERAMHVLAPVLEQSGPITLDLMRTPRRSYRVVGFKVEVSRVLRRELGWSLKKIAAFLCCDHSTVFHYLHMPQDRVEMLKASPWPAHGSRFYERDREIARRWRAARRVKQA